MKNGDFPLLFVRSPEGIPNVPLRSSSMSILVVSNNIYPIRSWWLQIHPDLVWCHSVLLYCLQYSTVHQAVICSDSLLSMCDTLTIFNWQKRTPTSSAPSKTEPPEFGALVARMPATKRELQRLIRQRWLCRWSATSIALDYDGETTRSAKFPCGFVWK